MSKGVIVTRDIMLEPFVRPCRGKRVVMEVFLWSS